jgi:hypothetical protein
MPFIMSFDNINYNLNLLQEECGEVGVIASKILRFGLISYNPYDPEMQRNYQLLEQELGDILAIIDILIDNDIGITPEGLQEAKLRKLAKLPRFYSGEFANNTSGMYQNHHQGDGDKNA